MFRKDIKGTIFRNSSITYEERTHALTIAKYGTFKPENLDRMFADNNELLGVNSKVYLKAHFNKRCGSKTKYRPLYGNFVKFRIFTIPGFIFR